MRLIDADAFKDYCRTGLSEARTKIRSGSMRAFAEELTSSFIRDIDEQPTVEPEQRTGKWIYHIDDLFPAESTQECDQCHSEQPLECDDNYCPNCGVKMMPSNAK